MMRRDCIITLQGVITAQELNQKVKDIHGEKWALDPFIMDIESKQRIKVIDEATMIREFTVPCVWVGWL